MITPNSSGEDDIKQSIMEVVFIKGEPYYRNILNPKDKCFYSKTRGKSILNKSSNLYKLEQLLKMNSYVEVISNLNMSLHILEHYFKLSLDKNIKTCYTKDMLEELMNILNEFSKSNSTKKL